MLMTTVHLPGTVPNDSHMVMHTAIINADISLARVFQKHLSDPKRAHVFIDHGKYRKQYSACKWTECE